MSRHSKGASSRRSNRPLLNVPNPQGKLAELIAERHPVYAEADIIVDSDDSPPEVTVDRVMTALRQYLSHSASQGSAA